MNKDVLFKLTERTDLTADEARAVMEYVLSGHAPEVDLAALLVALRTKGESVTELCAFLSVMRAHMVPVECAAATIDLCGTGGDHSGSFNLSTAAALVAAAGGVPVAKHGNRAITSQSGSADFLDALGIPTSLSADAATQALRRTHFAFLFAPNFHPAMKAVAPVRRQLGIRTVFNLLGPLCNPAGVKRQLVGVYAPELLAPLAEVLLQSGAEHALLVHADGLDEISAAGETLGIELHNGRLQTVTLTPQTFGLSAVERSEIRGGNAQENADRFRAVAQGGEAQLAEWIVVNAAPAFYLAGKAASLREGAECARAVIQSGVLVDFLTQLAQHD